MFIVSLNLLRYFMEILSLHMQSKVTYYEKELSSFPTHVLRNNFIQTVDQHLGMSVLLSQDSHCFKPSNTIFHNASPSFSFEALRYKHSSIILLLQKFLSQAVIIPYVKTGVWLFNLSWGLYCVIFTDNHFLY